MTNSHSSRVRLPSVWGLGIGSLIVTVALLIEACATVVSGRTQKIEIRSEPPEVLVTAQPGGHHATTPGSLTLPRLGSGYRLRFEKQGYAPLDIRLESSTNGWVWGNVLIGGLIGLMVDYTTGAAYEMSPAEVEARLTPVQAAVGARSQKVLYVFDQDNELALTLWSQ